MNNSNKSNVSADTLPIGIEQGIIGRFLEETKILL